MKHARSVVVRSANKRLFAERKATIRRSARARGFTLTELLVVISIIGIIASFALVALSSARHQARITKTKALIAKLDNLVRERYADYRHRRLPIGMTTSSNFPLPARSAAIYRLRAIRDIMRMEMPERWADIEMDPIAYDPSDGQPIARPALSRAYWRRTHPQGTAVPLGEYASAECLYLIVTMGTDDGRSQFAEHDIGDADSDGYPEFHDAWGNPIKFLRWAPGFLADSDVQTGNPVDDHDPLDTSKSYPNDYRLVPLIYSAGPDGIYDINVEGGNYFYGNALNPYAQNVGEPIDSDNMSVTTGEVPANGRLDHYDNIHNHRIEAE